jgi:NAD(P)H-hydrate epimerase
VIPVLTAAEMREADRRTIEERGVPGVTLMESAGMAVAAAVRERFPYARRIGVLCGRGNNGGDGFVAARHLKLGTQRVWLLGRRADVRGDAAAHLARYEAGGGLVEEVPDEATWRAVSDDAMQCDLVVDAILGTGLREAPAGLAGAVIADLDARRPPVLAVDVPSGLSSDTGDVPWPAVTAEVTVTFAAAKHCHAWPPACDRVGELRVTDIGIPRDLVGHARVWMLESADAARAWPRRDPAAHKGTFGHVLVIGGAMGKTGAAALAAMAALRAGAGLVTVATAAPALPLVAAVRPELMTEPLEEAGGALAAAAVERALELAEARDAVVLGPGLGLTEQTRRFVRAFAPRCTVPLIVDADGLNAFTAQGTAPAALDLLRRTAATVITPHPGEMARLAGLQTADVQARRLETARQMAGRTGAVVALKGQRTVIARPDGLAAVNPTGNPGMATGGTGDVLSGMVGALLARGCDAWLATTAAVFAHGRAGDRAASRLGQESLVAGDVVDALPEALRGLEVAHR